MSLSSDDHDSATLKGLDENRHRSVPPYHQAASGDLHTHPALGKHRQRFDFYDRPVMQILEPSNNNAIESKGKSIVQPAVSSHLVSAPLTKLVSLCPTLVPDMPLTR